MEKTNMIEQIKDLITNANKIAVVPSKTAGLDSFTAGVGIYYAIKELGKDVSLIYLGRVPEKAEGLIQEDKIVSDVENRELVVSIDYSETPAAKVRYDNSTPGLLYLRLSPIDKNYNVQENIRAGVKGHEYDLIVTVGAPVLRDLGRAYNELELELNKVKIINIDNTDMNHRYGKVNVIDAKKDSLSLLVLSILSQAEYAITTKSAKALLTGISSKELE
jgi:nanoRNase/pAp phosphatase (c-di-AMP/oligoRNAs hydrolase)